MGPITEAVIIITSIASTSFFQRITHVLEIHLPKIVVAMRSK